METAIVYTECPFVYPKGLIVGPGGKHLLCRLWFKASRGSIGVFESKRIWRNDVG